MATELKMNHEILLAREAENQDRIWDALQHLLNSVNFFHLLKQDGKRTSLEEIKRIYKTYNRYVFYYSPDFVADLL